MYSGVTMRFAEAALAGRQLTVYGDGRQARDFVHVDDVVAATILAAERNGAKGGTFNVGTGSGTTILRLARLFLASARNRKTGIVHVEPKPGDIRQSWASIDKAKSILRYKPRVELEMGLESFLSWYSSVYHR